MPTIVLRKLSEPENLSDDSLLNTVKPLNYNEWLTRNTGIIPDQSQKQYQKYLNAWYDNQKSKNDLTINSEKIKQDYIGLLKKLQIVFKDDAEFERVANIDFDSNTDIKLAIPFFARKLKEIALYYVNQRERLKKSKLKNNLIGSFNALDKILYEHILSSFTRKNENVNIPTNLLYSAIPSLSSVSQDFQIEIEELYDLTNYFESTEKPDELGKYDLFSTNTLLFVLQDFIDEVYQANNFLDVPLSGLANPLLYCSPCETEDSIAIEYVSKLNSKYLGNNIYSLTGGYWDWNIRDINFNFQTGDNFFYWFSGEYIREQPDGLFLGNKINDIVWDNATGSSNISASDVVFVMVGNLLNEGAWLQKANEIVIDDTMKATMVDGKTFKFPYPGFGRIVNADDWTGKTITDTEKNDPGFFPSETVTNDSINRAQNRYWAAHDSVSAVQAILLNDTNLNTKGFASVNFPQADKIIVRNTPNLDFVHDTNPNEIYNGILEVAWLFNFKKTELPIAIGTNSIYYPLQTFNNVSELSFRYESGDPIALSDIPVEKSFSGAVAGATINDADLLIKLNSVCGPEVEVAWLKGYPLSAFSPSDTDRCNCVADTANFYTGVRFSTGVTQPGLSFKCDSGKFNKFIWTGPNTNINDVKGFTGFRHDASCEYFKTEKFESILELNFLKEANKGNYEKWKKCNCRAVNHSPLGHKGSSMLSYKYPTDFIIKDTDQMSDIDIDTWIGTDGKKYTESNDSVWFKIDDLKEPDVGWGKGEWVNDNSAAFILETGKTYYYYRSDLNRCNFELPYFVINEGYKACKVTNCDTQDCVPVWTKGKVNKITGLYEDMGVPSDMIMDSGGFYTYKHKDVQKYSQKILTYGGKYVNNKQPGYVTYEVNDAKIDWEEKAFSNPAINFTIRIPMSNTIPFWGDASFTKSDSTQSKKVIFGYDQYATKYDYLLIAQPKPSTILLSDNTVIEYKITECGQCFVWEQPLAFNVKEDFIRWNKILMDECVRSELTDYFHRQSDLLNSKGYACSTSCEQICDCSLNTFIHKTGLTASFIPSDLTFNTELSGIPMFVNYHAINNFSQTVKVTDVSNGMPPNGGLWVPPISTLYVEAQKPWANIINDLLPMVAADNKNGNLVSSKELGLFTPARTNIGKYELHKGNISENTSLTANSLIRSDNYVDGGLQLNSIDSSWFKHVHGQGIIGNTIVNKRQTWHPYNTDFDVNYSCNYGLYNRSEKFSPWTAAGEWKFDSEITPFCGPNAWYSTNQTLTGNVVQWQNDIYGNQYFLLSPSGTRLHNSNEYKQLYVKALDNRLQNGTDFLNKIFEKYISL